MMMARTDEEEIPFREQVRRAFEATPDPMTGEPPDDKITVTCLLDGTAMEMGKPFEFECPKCRASVLLGVTELGG